MILYCCTTLKLNVLLSAATRTFFDSCEGGDGRHSILERHVFFHVVRVHASRREYHLTGKSRARCIITSRHSGSAVLPPTRYQVLVLYSYYIPGTMIRTHGMGIVDG